MAENRLSKALNNWIAHQLEERTLIDKLNGWRIKRALKRNFLLRKLRCRLGAHNPPGDCYFEEWGSVMVGGPCTECNDETWHDVCWLGDVWDFPGATTQETTDSGGKVTTIHDQTLDTLVRAHVAKLLA